MKWTDKLLGAVFASEDKAADSPEIATRAAPRPGTNDNIPRAGEASDPDAGPPSKAAGALTVDELERGIRESVEQAQGFTPYANFAEKLKKLSSVGNERERYAAALSVADLPLDTVITALNSHKTTLGEEKSRFEQDFAAPTQSSIDSLKDKETALQGEIDALNREVAEKTAQREETARAISDGAANLAKRRIDFDTACSSAARYYDGIVHTLQNNLGAPVNGQ